MHMAGYGMPFAWHILRSHLRTPCKVRDSLYTLGLEEDLHSSVFNSGDKALRDQWKDPQACRKFFDDFAKEEGFDSLNPTSWYSINLHSMLLRKVHYMRNICFNSLMILI